MGKTRRQGPDNENFSEKLHRISRRDIAAVNRAVAAHILSTLQIPQDNYVELPVEDVPAEVSRDKRLDLIQLAGEEIVKSEGRQ